MENWIWFIVDFILIVAVELIIYIICSFIFKKKAKHLLEKELLEDAFLMKRINRHFDDQRIEEDCNNYGVIATPIVIDEENYFSSGTASFFTNLSIQAAKEQEDLIEIQIKKRLTQRKMMSKEGDTRET